MSARLSKRSIPTKLPPSLYQYFWEVNATEVDPIKSPQYVIQRLLDKGKREAYRFVFDNFPREMIIEIVKRRRGFSQETANFLALYLGIPKNEVVCLNRELIKIPSGLWQF